MMEPLFIYFIEKVKWHEAKMNALEDRVPQGGMFELSWGWLI